MRCYKIIPTFFFILGVSSAVQAGNTTAAFLKIGVGARPIGMGNAFTAVADDINSLAWNPAGLSLLSRRELGVMHSELFADTRYDFLGYAHPMKTGTLGLGINYLSLRKPLAVSNVKILEFPLEIGSWTGKIIPNSRGF